MIMIVKTPGSQMGYPASAEEGGEEVGGGRWESGERSEVQAIFETDFWTFEMCGKMPKSQNLELNLRLKRVRLSRLGG